MRRRRTVWPWLAIPALVSFGCATSVSPNRLSAEATEKFGRIAVVSARFAPPVGVTQARNVRPGEIAQGSLAGGALGGATGALAGCLVGLGCGPFAIVCCPAFALAGLGGGATIGAVSGGTITYLAGNADRIPASRTAKTLPTVNEVEVTAQNLLGGYGVQEAVREAVLKVGQAANPASFVRINDIGPMARDEQVSYRHTRSSGIDTILELSVESTGFTAKDFASDSPAVALFMAVRVRLIGAMSDEMLAALVHRYEGSKRNYKDWNEKLLKEEVDYAARSLAEKIVETLALAAMPADLNRSND